MPDASTVHEPVKKITNIAKIPFSCAALFFVFIGLFMFLAGFFPLVNNIQLLFSGARTTGTVVDIGAETSNYDKDNIKTSTSYLPVVEFTTEDNRVITFKPAIGSDANKTEKGQKVDVIYIKGNPNVAAINDDMNLWILPLTLFILGMAALGVGSYNIYKIWRKKDIFLEEKPFTKDVLKKDGRFFSLIVFAVISGAFLAAAIAISYIKYQDYISNNPESPFSDFVISEQGRSLFFLLISLIFCIASATTTVFWIRKKKRLYSLKTIGRRVEATVTAVEFTKISMNNIKGRRVVAKYTERGSSVDFYSEPYYIRSLEKIIRSGDKVDIYIDPSSPQNYFMDVENLRPAALNNSSNPPL